MTAIATRPQPDIITQLLQRMQTPAARQRLQLDRSRQTPQKPRKRAITPRRALLETSVKRLVDGRQPGFSRSRIRFVIRRMADADLQALRLRYIEKHAIAKTTSKNNALALSDRKYAKREMNIYHTVIQMVDTQLLRLKTAH